MNEILSIASLVAFGMWLATLRLWYGDLREANGSRPVILAMLIVGATLTVQSVAMLNVLLPHDDFSKIGWASAMSYRLVLIAVCVAMHALHRQVKVLARSHKES